MTKTETKTDTAAAFDPSVFAAANADTADMTVMHPITKEPTEWVIVFAGPTHPKSIALGDKFTREGLAKAKRIEQARTNGKKYKGENKSPDELRREAIENAVAQIVTWRGSSVEFSEKAAIDMLMDPNYYRLVNQITEFLDDEDRFIKTSAAT